MEKLIEKIKAVIDSPIDKQLTWQARLVQYQTKVYQIEGLIKRYEKEFGK